MFLSFSRVSLNAKVADAFHKKNFIHFVEFIEKSCIIVISK